MARIDLVCKDCDHKFTVVTRAAIREKQKRCPECSSGNVRQTIGSYFQNGPLSSPTCGAPQRSTGYG
jgi:putative FmdB family regulatory protein